ncbi:MAG: protein-export chaperone SecB [Deltaproteobacteria bacterium]|nr:protein-export chaperone SecB [Deltaproteobacteria bacterium]
MPLPIQLEQYFFSRVTCEANPTFNPKEGSRVDFNVNVQHNLARHEDNPCRWQLALHIQTSPASKSMPYTIELELVGFFLADEGASRPEEMIRVRGVEMLYSGARELILGLTARGPWFPLALPMIDFTEPPNPVA